MYMCVYIYALLNMATVAFFFALFSCAFGSGGN